MSFVCCEAVPTALNTCAVAEVSGTIANNLFTSAPVTIDVSRAPYRRACVSANAPVTLSTGLTEGSFLYTLTLSLFREGTTGSIYSASVSSLLASNSVASITPALLHQVDPGRYYIVLTVSPAFSSVTSVIGNINVSASVSNLAL